MNLGTQFAQMEGDEAMQHARGHAKITSFPHPSMHKEPPLGMLACPWQPHVHAIKAKAWPHARCQGHGSPT